MVSHGVGKASESVWNFVNFMAPLSTCQGLVAEYKRFYTYREVFVFALNMNFKFTMV